MQRNIQLLHLSYWIGAIIDAIDSIFLIVPTIFVPKEGIPDFVPCPNYVFAMSLGASLIFGWTVLIL